MPMTDDKVRSAFQACAEVLARAGYNPVKSEDPGERAHWCAVTAPQFLTEGRREKAMRWLGFCQGVLFGHGLVTVEDIKNMSRPDNA